MNDLPTRVAAFIQQRNLAPRGQAVLVAVSGGLDSMVLLRLLHGLSKEQGWPLTVAHFNHQLRGRASDGDERFVQRTADAVGRPFVAGRADVQALADQHKLSLETAARQSRHQFLARAARELKISVVALAHHADDQVELFFLRLLRGTGGRGLGGMLASSPSPVDVGVTLIRPLLDCSKCELLAYAKAQDLKFRTDASNRSDLPLRNRIRNRLLPLINEHYQPGITGNVLRLMEIVGTEAAFVEATAGEWLRKRKSSFARLGVAVQRQVLCQQCTAHGLPTDFSLIEALRARPETWIAVNPELQVARNSSGRLLFRKPPLKVANLSLGSSFQTAKRWVRLARRQGSVKFGKQQLRWAVRRATGALQLAGGSAETFDADRVGGQILLRHWQPGDRFQPLGLARPTKLQDLFVNAKIPASERRSLIVAATTAGDIFWVQHLRPGHQFRVTPETKRHLLWKCDSA